MPLRKATRSENRGSAGTHHIDNPLMREEVPFICYSDEKLDTAKYGHTGLCVQAAKEDAFDGFFEGQTHAVSEGLHG